MHLQTYEFIGANSMVQGDPLRPVLEWEPQPVVHALYLHVPFCFHKCHYCDFYSVVREDSSLHTILGDAMARELTARCAQLNPRPDTVFVGGGTPTLLAPEAWQALLGAMRRLGVLEAVTEFTVEANPETVAAPLLGLLVSGGVTRLSIGAQSFNPRHLKTLERWHDPASVTRSVQLARQAGLTRLNLDLIFAIPGQTVAEFDDDLSRALDLGPDHLSCYNLTYEPKTAMTTRLRKGEFTPCDESVERAMYEHALDRLAAEGFEHYEVSAWARHSGGGGVSGGGQQCRHNLHYWRNDHWLGIGPGAASHVAGTRWRNKPHLDQYIAASPTPPVLDVEHLDQRGRDAERLMLGLRLREGVDAAWFDAAFADRAQDVQALTNHGLLERLPDRLRLTRNGLMIADDVIAQLM